MSRSVTLSDVENYGFRRYIETLTAPNTTLNFLAWGDGESVLDDAESDNSDFDQTYTEGYEVVYNHEAFDIVQDGEFETEGELDFSECEDATACVLLEARASVGAPFNQGWSDARERTQSTLDTLIDYIGRNYPDVDDYSFCATLTSHCDSLMGNQVFSERLGEDGELTEYRLNGNVLIEYVPYNNNEAVLNVKFNPSDFTDEDAE